MAGLINLKLLADFFNKIGHERRFLNSYKLRPLSTRSRPNCCITASDVTGQFQTWWPSYDDAVSSFSSAHASPTNGNRRPSGTALAFVPRPSFTAFLHQEVHDCQ